MHPAQPPVGLHLTRAARTVGRAFDDALSQAGGSLPVWLVLVNLKANSRAAQREIADAMGVSEATLTHHLNGMETQGLITRRRDPANRRVHLVELTRDGEETFVRLRAAALAFDRRLRRGVTENEVGQLRGLLDRLAKNVATGLDDLPHWGGLVESRH
jgi:MarR family transcriptional regulator for hemolysin